MAAPILVRAYSSTTGRGKDRTNPRGAQNANMQALPPIASYAFADILRSVDSSDFEGAIDGIAGICAKNRMSLADEYASHLPPLGEITSPVPLSVRPQTLRPTRRRALTSVPEASSSSSETSIKASPKRSGMFSFRRKQEAVGNTLRQVRVGSMGRTLSICSTTAMATNLDQDSQITGTHASPSSRPLPPKRAPSEATLSLQRLLSTQRLQHSG